MAPSSVASSNKKMIRTCSIWRSLEVVGDTASLLVLEAIWWGDRRYDRIQTKSGLQKALVSDRLKKLIDADILSKRLYMERPARYEYILTAKGRDLFETALMLLRWELKWSSQRSRIKTRLLHNACDEVVNPEPHCGSCGKAVDARDIDWREGPGVGLMAPVYSRRRPRRSTASDEAAAPSIFTEAAELMGDRWGTLVLRSIFIQLRKFDEILNDTAIAPNILSERLTWLMEFGVIRAVLYQNNPNRFEYWLTQKGLDYYPVLMMLQQWGDKYYASPEGPPLILHHRTCGGPLNPYVGCSHCGEALTPTNTRFETSVSDPANKETEETAL